MPIWRKISAQFLDPLIYLLLAAVAISLLAWALGGRHDWPVDAIVIAVVVVLNAVLGYVQESRPRVRWALQEMTADGLVGVDALLGCALTESPNRCQLPLLRPAPRKGGVSQNVQILTQQLDRGFSIRGRRTGHHRQPIIVGCVVIDRLLVRIPM